MVKGKWLITAALALSTTGCIESMDGGYAGSSAIVECQSICGMPRLGSPCGISPTIRPPIFS